MPDGQCPPLLVCAPTFQFGTALDASAKHDFTNGKIDAVVNLFVPPRWMIVDNACKYANVAMRELVAY